MCTKTKAEDIKTEAAIMYFSIIRTLKHSYLRNDDYFLPESILESLAKETVDWVADNIEDRKHFNNSRFEFMRNMSQCYAELILGE